MTCDGYDVVVDEGVRIAAMALLMKVGGGAADASGRRRWRSWKRNCHMFQYHRIIGY